MSFCEDAMAESPFCTSVLATNIIIISGETCVFYQEIETTNTFLLTIDTQFNFSG